MHWLIIFLANFLSAAIAWLVSKFSAQVAMSLLLIAAFTAAWATVTAAIWTGMSAFVLAAPAASQLFFFFPDNTPEIIGARVAFDFAFAFYRYTSETIRLKAYVT